MMPLPQKFDANEWFLIIWLIISYVVALSLPKRFPSSLTLLYMLYGPIAARISDHVLSSPKYDLYTLMDTEKYELFDAITYFLYAPFSYIFIYLFDRWGIRGYWILLYILISTSLGTMFEWLNEYFHVFTYKGWKLMYSFTVYLIVQCIILLFYQLVKRSYQSSTNQKSEDPST
jgi:hypothetical protein